MRPAFSDGLLAAEWLPEETAGVQLLAEELAIRCVHLCPLGGSNEPKPG